MHHYGRKIACDSRHFSRQRRRCVHLRMARGRPGVLARDAGITGHQCLDRTGRHGSDGRNGWICSGRSESHGAVARRGLLLDRGVHQLSRRRLRQRFRLFRATYRNRHVQFEAGRSASAPPHGGDIANLSSETRGRDLSHAVAVPQDGRGQPNRRANCQCC